MFGIPLDFAGERQVASGLTLNADLDRSGAAGGGQHPDQLGSLALQGPWLHTGAIEVHGHDACPAQTPNFFACQFSWVQFDLDCVSGHGTMVSDRFCAAC